MAHEDKQAKPELPRKGVRKTMSLGIPTDLRRMRDRLTEPLLLEYEGEECNSPSGDFQNNYNIKQDSYVHLGLVVAWVQY